MVNPDYLLAPNLKWEILTSRDSAESIVRKVAISKRIDPEYMFAIWQKESSKQILVDRGKRGEYSSFQIMPITGGKICSGRWKSYFKDNVKCAAQVLLEARLMCNGVRFKMSNYYNSGKCRKKSTKYAQDIEYLLMKDTLSTKKG